MCQEVRIEKKLESAYAAAHRPVPLPLHDLQKRIYCQHQLQKPICDHMKDENIIVNIALKPTPKKSVCAITSRFIQGNIASIVAFVVRDLMKENCNWLICSRIQVKLSTCWFTVLRISKLPTTTHAIILP